MRIGISITLKPADRKSSISARVPPNASGVHGLQPHRVNHFKFSTDPRFVGKLRDIVGLYVDPPAHAVVLSVDEKSQIQALDRTQPGLPMKPGRAESTCKKPSIASSPNTTQSQSPSPGLLIPTKLSGP